MSKVEWDSAEAVIPKNESYARSAAYEIAPERRAMPGWFQQLLLLFTVRRLIKNQKTESKNCLTLLNVLSMQVDTVAREVKMLREQVAAIRPADDEMTATWKRVTAGPVPTPLKVRAIRWDPDKELFIENDPETGDRLGTSRDGLDWTKTPK